MERLIKQIFTIVNNILLNSNYVSEHGLFLPSFITLTNEEILYICKLIRCWYSQSKNI